MNIQTEGPVGKLIRLRRRKSERNCLLQEMLLQMIGFLLLMNLIFGHVFGIHIAGSNEMYPAVQEGDVLLYYRKAGHLVGEAVVYENDGELHLGRIQAAAGSVIDETEDHQITIDGNFQPVQTRRGIFARTIVAKSGRLTLPAEIGPGEYFILCDDRTRLSDSRTYGLISEIGIRGQIVTVLRRRQI